MHDVSLDGKPRPVAETWDELSRQQLRRLMPILYGAYKDPWRQRIEVLEVLLGLSRALSQRLTPVQWVEIGWLADFLLVEPCRLTTQPLPGVQAGKPRRAYYGPEAELGNVSFLEFAFADAYFLAYCQSGEQRWLHLLLGTLYRPERPDYRPHDLDYGGDRRADFNQNLVEAHAAQLARLPVAEQLLILTYYRGCRAALEQRYARIFTAASTAETESHPDGWAYVLREMSGQAFGNYEQTGRESAHQVLAKMQDDLARASRLPGNPDGAPTS